MASSVPIINSALHALAQLVTGIGAGVLLDYGFTKIFPMDKYGTRIQDSKQAIIEFMECAAQVIASSATLGVVHNYLAALNESDADPASGMLFGILIYGLSQPQLQVRLKRLVAYAQDLIIVPAVATKSSEDPYFNNPFRSNSIPATAQDQSYRLRQHVLRRNGFADPNADAQLPTEERLVVSGSN